MQFSNVIKRNKN